MARATSSSSTIGRPPSPLPRAAVPHLANVTSALTVGPSAVKEALRSAQQAGHDPKTLYGFAQGQARRQGLKPPTFAQVDPRRGQSDRTNPGYSHRPPQAKDLPGGTVL